MISWVLIVLCLPHISNATDEVSAASLVNALEDRFSNVHALSYRVKRTVSLKNQPPNEQQWLFRFKEPDRIRIDYLQPYERLVILDGKAVLEFIPELKKAVKTDLTVMTQEQRTKFRDGILSFISIDGLRLNGSQKRGLEAAAVRRVRWFGADAYMIEGGDPRYVLYIDKEKKVLLRVETYDTSGSLVLRADASRFTEAFKDFWLPQEIHTTHHTSDGYIRSVVLLQDIHANVTIPDEQFRFNAPPGVEVMSFPNAPDKIKIPPPGAQRE